MTTNKEYNSIFSEYNKKLLAEHKANFSAMGNGLSYFITYLRMLRDYYILADTPAEQQDEFDMKATSLAAAVGEFDSYRTCIKKYYKIVGNAIERISDEPEESVAKKYDAERKFHWTNFWQLVMTNIEDWTVNG